MPHNEEQKKTWSMQTGQETYIEVFDNDTAPPAGQNPPLLPPLQPIPPTNIEEPSPRRQTRLEAILHNSANYAESTRQSSFANRLRATTNIAQRPPMAPRPAQTSRLPDIHDPRSARGM